MLEPTSSATATLIMTGVTVPALTAFGVSLGLRPDVLVAGLFGACVAIILLDTVPSSGDTWRELLRTSFKRMAVACASSLTAGYLTPLVLLAFNVPLELLLSMAFLVGVSAQRYLVRFIVRYGAATGKPEGGAS